MWTMELMGATPVGSILGTFWALWAPKGRPASQQQQQRPASQIKSGASPRVDASLGVDPASQLKSGASPRVDKARGKFLTCYYTRCRFRPMRKNCRVLL